MLKTVVITGPSSGIGRATALALAKKRYNLVLASRRRAPLEEVARECEEMGVRVLVVPTDVTDPDAVIWLADRAVAHFKTVDVWVNNAGVGAVGDFARTPISTHHQVIETNLMGCLNGAYAILPHFQSRRKGVIINVNSAGAYVPTPYAAAYAASKFGLRGFSEALKAELKHIDVCDVYPYFTDTPGFRHGANFTGKKIGPMPPVYNPEQVADAIVRTIERPRKKVNVGAPVLLGRIVHAVAPALTAWAMAQMMRKYLALAEPAPVTEGHLFLGVEGTAA